MARIPELPTTETAPLAGDFLATHRSGDQDAEKITHETLVDTRLSSGKTGSRTIAGGTAASEDLTLTSTAHATKDRVFLGSAQTSAFDELNSRLGIGTGSPGATLDVRGAVIVNEAGADADVRIEGDTDQNLLFTDASTDRVGVGTAAPGAKLDVRGSATFNEDGADADFRVEGDTDANLLMVDASTDRVGIGTSTPGGKLHIDGGANTSAIVEFDNSANNFSEFTFKDAAANRWGFGVVSAASTIPSPFYVFQYTDASGAAANAYRLALTNEGNASFFALPTTASWQGMTRGIRMANGGTAPSGSPVDGVFLQCRDSAAGHANLYARNENGDDERLTGLCKRSTAQLDKTTDTTLANIAGLSFNVEAGKYYKLTAVVDFDANATGGYKFAIGGTATATSFRGSLVVIATAPAPALGTSARLTTLGTGAGSATATAGIATITGYILVNAAGTLTVQFAQNAATGTSSALVNSTFELKPIGQ